MYTYKLCLFMFTLIIYYSLKVVSIRVNMNKHYFLFFINKCLTENILYGNCIT